MKQSTINIWFKTTKYKNYDITYNFYRTGEYTVFYCGDDVVFNSEKEAMDFINHLTD